MFHCESCNTIFYSPVGCSEHQCKMVPHPTFDKNGYPTEETEAIIEDWDVCDLIGLFGFIESAWHSNGIFQRKGWRIELITGGWSGNEGLVHAFQQNIAWSLCWESSHRGGLHKFLIPKNFRKKRETNG